MSIVQQIEPFSVHPFVLGVLVCLLPMTVYGQDTKSEAGERRYQGQSTPAILDNSAEGLRPEPVVTFEATDEVLPAKEEGYQAKGSTLAAFQEIWAERGLAMQRGDKSQEYRLLAKLQNRKELSGWPNLFHYGRILAREAERAYAEGSLATANERAMAAIALAPQQPGVQALAGKVLILSPAHRGDGLKALIRSLGLSLSEPGHLRVRVGQLLFALWLSVLCASLVFGFIMALRSCGKMHAAILERLPRGTAGFQAGLIVLLIVTTPILFGFGVTLTLVWWISFFGFWMRQAERLAAVVVLSWVTLLPLTLPFALGHLKYPGSFSETVYLAGRDIESNNVQARLDAVESPDARVMYLKGMRDYWRGDLPQALQTLEEAALKPDAGPEVFTALGNFRFRDGQKTRAVQAYDEALSRDPSRVIALFNKSRVLYKMADHAKAGEAHALASDIDLRQVTKLSEAAQGDDRFYVADEPVSAGLLHGDAWSLHVDDSVADSFWARFSTYERRHCALLGLIGLVITFVVLFAKQTIVRAEGRSRAKGFSKRRRTSSRPPQERSLQIREQIREHRRQARLRRLRRVLGLVMAGGGHMIYGAPLTGLLFSCLFVMSLLLYLVSIDLLPTLVRIDEAALSLFGIPWGVVVVGVYVVSLVMRPEEDW